MARPTRGPQAIEDADNVVLVRSPGADKTHLATAFALQAIQHRRYHVVPLNDRTCKRAGHSRQARLLAVQPGRWRLPVPSDQ